MPPPSASSVPLTPRSSGQLPSAQLQALQSKELLLLRVHTEGSVVLHEGLYDTAEGSRVGVMSIWFFCAVFKKVQRGRTTLLAGQGGEGVLFWESCSSSSSSCSSSGFLIAYCCVFSWHSELVLCVHLFGQTWILAAVNVCRLAGDHTLRGRRT